MSTTAKGKTAGKQSVKSVNDLEIKSNRIYEFELLPKNGKIHDGTYILPKQALSYDEATNSNRRIRLSEGEESPFLDEQSDHATSSRELLTFKRGKLTVSGSRSNVVRYLLAFDGNSGKGQIHHSNKNLSFKYKLKDKEELFRKSASDIKLELKAKTAIAEGEIEDLRAFLVAYYDYKVTTDTDEELFAVAIGKAESNPEFVLKNFKTEGQNIKYKIIEGFKNELILNTKGVVTWADTGMEVGKFGNAEIKLSDDMTAWIIKGTKESKDFIGRLTDSLGKL